MKFNTASTAEATRAFEYLTELVGRHGIVDIRKVSPVRSLSQNAYLHLLISAFGAHFGYSSIEGKQLYKELNKDIYEYTKKGRKFYKSSAELSKEDMARSVDRFMAASESQGYPLPLATDQGWLMQIQNTIEQNQRYL